jgi:flagellar basal-body rod modification protein FlgD
MMMMSTINTQNQLQYMQNQTNRVNYEKGVQSRGSSDLGKDGFFQLMLAQMKNQNPLEPQDSSQQMMQQAQFTQIEELQTLNSNMSKFNMVSSASNYVGKSVSYEFNGQTKTGVVDKVTFGDDSIGLHIGTDIITPEQVKELRAATPATPQT